MTVVHELSRQHALAGGMSSVAVARGTYSRRYDSAHAVEFEAAKPVTRSTKGLEAVGGWLGRPRIVCARRYAPGFVALDALNDSSVLIVHNAPEVGWLTTVPPSQTTVLYCHNDLFNSYSKREMRSLGDRWTHVICVSDYIAEKLLRKAPSWESKLHVVLNGVDTEVFEPGPRQASVIEQETRVLALGRIQPEKGFHVLTEAARLLGDRRVTIDIVGSSGFDARTPLSQYERQLRASAHDATVSVRFLPFQPRVLLPGLLRQYDILIVPSIFQEPFSLALLEGMSTGLAVVASRVGGIPQVLDGAGMTFKAGSAAELTSLLLSLHADHALLQTWGSRARRRAEQLTWGAAYDSLASAIT